MTTGAVNFDDPRDRTEKLIDRLMMLYLFDRVSDISRITGDVKLQKLVFLAENDMLEEKVNGLNYKFFRWDFGPMSKGVYEDHAYLIDNGLVSESQGKTLESGRELLSQTIPVLEENSEITRKIDDVVASFGDIGGGRLKHIVYDKEISPDQGFDRIRVEEIPKGYDIFNPHYRDDLRESFEISPDWAETLSLLFDSRTRKSVLEASESAKKEKSTKFEPVDV